MALRFFHKKLLILIVLFTPFFLLVTDVSAQSVVDMTGHILNKRIHEGSVFQEGKTGRITVSAIVSSGHQVLQCPVQGDPQLTPLDIDEVFLTTSWEDRISWKDPVFREGRESPRCVGLPTLKEHRVFVDFTIGGIRDLPPGPHTIQFNVDAQGPINNKDIPWGSSNDVLEFTILPRPLRVDLVPSLSVSPNNVFDGEKVEINYTVENKRGDLAENVEIEIYDNGNRRYRANLGDIAGHSSKFGTITRKLRGVGRREIRIEVDPGRMVEETREDNNSKTRSVTVKAEVVDPPKPSTGRILVRAKLDGNDWSGGVNYEIRGPHSINGRSVNESFNNQPVGNWTFSYGGGGPSNSTLDSISSSNSQTLVGDGTIIFTLNFNSNVVAPSGKPNLTPARPQTNGGITPGSSTVFLTDISNNGGVSTGSGFRVEFEIDGITFSSNNESALDSGGSTRSVSSSWTATGIGLHQARVCTDTENSVSESNESDNCSTNVIEVIDPNGDGDDDGGGNDNGGNNNDNSGGGDSDNVSDNNGGGNNSDGDNNGGQKEQPNPECSDGVDNDADGWVDDVDPGCSDGDVGNNGEAGNGGTQCSDGIDNDDDGFIDGNDPHCSSSADNTEKPISFEEF